MSCFAINSFLLCAKTRIIIMQLKKINRLRRNRMVSAPSLHVVPSDSNEEPSLALLSPAACEILYVHHRYDADVDRASGAIGYYSSEGFIVYRCFTALMDDEACNRTSYLLRRSDTGDTLAIHTSPSDDTESAHYDAFFAGVIEILGSLPRGLQPRCFRKLTNRQSEDTLVPTSFRALALSALQRATDMHGLFASRFGIFVEDVIEAAIQAGTVLPPFLRELKRCRRCNRGWDFEVRRAGQPPRVILESKHKRKGRRYSFTADQIQALSTSAIAPSSTARYIATGRCTVDSVSADGRTGTLQARVHLFGVCQTKLKFLLGDMPDSDYASIDRIAIYPPALMRKGALVSAGQLDAVVDVKADSTVEVTGIAWRPSLQLQQSGHPAAD